MIVSRRITDLRRSIAPAFVAALLFGAALRCHAENGTPTPLTDNDAVLLADIENKTGDAVFDHSLKQALMLELGQSPFLNMTSDRKLSDTLRSMGRPANEHITMGGSREVCNRSGSAALLGGSVANVGDHYSIELIATSCGTGASLALESGQATSKQDVLRVFSEACFRLRKRLGESPESVKKFSLPVTTTTQSLEALDSYNMGITVRREKSDEESLPFLKKAIALDPNFPLAYAELAAIYRNLRQPSLALQYASKAYRLQDRGSQRESMHMAAIYFLVTGEVDKEIPIYERWEVLYPRDYIPLNNLGNAYAALGQLDKSLIEYKKALRLMPSMIGYTNVVGMEITLYQLDEAQATFDEAFAAKFDGGYLHQNLYWLASLREDHALMSQQVAWAAGKPGDEDALLSIQSDSQARQGLVDKARGSTRQAVESAIRADLKETAALWQVNAALREAEIGNMAAAQQGASAALSLSSGRDVKLISAFTLARARVPNQAKTLLKELERAYPTDTLMKNYWIPAIRASIALDANNSTEALDDLKTTAPYELGNAGMFINYLYPAYLRGEGYLRAHNGEAAAIEFQKLLDHRGVVSNFVTGALVHLQLGRAYALSGNAFKAKESYQAFFSLWKNADRDVPVLKQARSEYAKLTS